MGLTLVTPPTLEPVDLEEAKVHLRVSHFDEDSYIASLITAARQYAETVSRLQFVTATWKQTWNCFATWKLHFDANPVQSITQVAYTTDGSNTVIITPTDYRLSNTGSQSYVTPALNRFWPIPARVSDAVWVTYVAGFGSPAAVPKTIKQAILLLVAHWYENREPVVTGTIATAIPTTVEALLGSESPGVYV